MALCPNPVSWRELKTGAKYAVFDETGKPVLDDDGKDQIVGWFSAQGAIRNKEMGMIFRTDTIDVLHWIAPPKTKGGRVVKSIGRPIQLLGFGYGSFPNLTPGPIEKYRVIPTYDALKPAGSEALEGFEYRYCLVEEAPEDYRKLDETAPVGAKRRRRKTRGRSRKRKATRRR